MFVWTRSDFVESLESKISPVQLDRYLRWLIQSTFEHTLTNNDENEYLMLFTANEYGAHNEEWFTLSNTYEPVRPLSIRMGDSICQS